VVGVCGGGGGFFGGGGGGGGGGEVVRAGVQSSSLEDSHPQGSTPLHLHGVAR